MAPSGPSNKSNLVTSNVANCFALPYSRNRSNEQTFVSSTTSSQVRGRFIETPLIKKNTTNSVLSHRFCYQPGDQLSQQNAPISTSCVYCNKQQFDHTLFKCTGISAVQQYINTTQAFCIMTQCLEQIRNQVPVLLGR